MDSGYDMKIRKGLHCMITSKKFFKGNRIGKRRAEAVLDETKTLAFAK